MIRVGLLSDTHGLLRDGALRHLRGCDHIVHGGDIGGAAGGAAGGAEILERLAALAPLTAVRGNNDAGPWAQRLQETEIVAVGTIAICVVHNLAELDLPACVRATPNLRVVVSGHSHKPSISERDGVLLVNPGSCGPRRFSLPVSLGELVIRGADFDARIIELTGAQLA
jgi:putative phosphoesterase